MENASGQSNCNGSTSSQATFAHPARYAVLEFETLLDSSSIDSKGWAEIAQTIFRNYKLFDGFVVLHGTDSLAYTCSALSFMLQNLGKPVIVTGPYKICSESRKFQLTVPRFPSSVLGKKKRRPRELARLDGHRRSFYGPGSVLMLQLDPVSRKPDDQDLCQCL